MTRDEPAEHEGAALGFRVKSGWAVAVLLAGTCDSPRLVRCQAALLSDPRVPESKQPYHVALELPEKEAAALVQKLCKIVAYTAKRSVVDLLKQAKAEGCVVRGAMLVVGSVVDPSTLHNEHIRAHALEGRLFRTVLERALRAHQLPCDILLEKNAYAMAAKALRKTPAEVKRAATSIGEAHDGSWTAEQKLASTGAWLALRAQR